MENITFKTSIVYDAICFCEVIMFKEMIENGNRNQSQLDLLKYFYEKTELSDIEGEIDSMSNMCGVLYRYDSNSADWTLSQLLDFFHSIKNGNLLNTFHNLTQEITDNYIKIITSLVEIDFENYWSTNILPIEKESISQIEQSISKYDLSTLFKLISDMKRTKKIDNAFVFVSELSCPVSFSLSNNAFFNMATESIDAKQFISTVAHELMHGFASNELTQLYLEFIEKNRYLTSTHKSLLEDMWSGDEEEFVMAAEYYLVYKAEIMTFDEIVSNNWNRYGGCVPLSLYIFGLICENEVTDYNNYLISLFKNQLIKIDELIPAIDSMLPEITDLQNFYPNFFVRLQRCVYIIHSAQIDSLPELDDRIEESTKSKFIPNSDKTVKFIFEEIEIPSESATRKTLVNDNLKIDAITFPTKGEALQFNFHRNGANISPCPVVWNDEQIISPYVLNLTFPENEPLRIEISFVCGTTRYLVSVKCANHIIKTDKYGNEVIEKYGKEIIKDVEKAVEVVMLMNN